MAREKEAMKETGRGLKLAVHSPLHCTPCAPSGCHPGWRGRCPLLAGRVRVRGLLRRRFPAR